tara:strand:- start:696 stop:914 length:219 start_codon:yes stop_codon:yes gene_type:complete
MKYLIALFALLAMAGCETHRKSVVTTDTPRLTCGVIKSQHNNQEFTNSVQKLKWVSIDGGVYQTLVNANDTD